MQRILIFFVLILLKFKNVRQLHLRMSVCKSIRWRCDSLLRRVKSSNNGQSLIDYWTVTEMQEPWISYYHSTHHLPVYIHLLRGICVPPLSGFDLWAQMPRDRRFQLLYSLMYSLSGQQGTISQSYLTSFHTKPGPFPEISPRGVWTNGRLVEKLIFINLSKIMLYAAFYSSCKGHLSPGDRLIFLLHYCLSLLSKTGQDRRESQN